MAAPLIGVTPMYAVCFLGFGIGKKLQTPAGPNGDYTCILISFSFFSLFRMNLKRKRKINF
jgi:hypothetical protein